jgi:hypothetical protein
MTKVQIIQTVGFENYNFDIVSYLVFRASYFRGLQRAANRE